MSMNLPDILFIYVWSVASKLNEYQSHVLVLIESKIIFKSCYEKKKKKYWKYAHIFLLFKDNTTVDYFRSVNLIPFPFSPPGKLQLWHDCADVSACLTTSHMIIVIYQQEKGNLSSDFDRSILMKRKKNNEERNTVAIHDGRVLLTGALNQEIIWFTTTENVLMPWAKRKFPSLFSIKKENIWSRSIVKFCVNW